MATKEYSRASLDSISQESTIQEDTSFFHHQDVRAKKAKSAQYPVLLILLLALLVSNGAWTWTYLSRSSTQSTVSGSQRPTRLRSHHWDTPYSSDNKTITNKLWKDLFPDGQGLITLPNTAAAAQHLPASVSHNGNTSASVYFVAAYHQIHCLTVIRAALYHFSEGVEQTVPLPHVLHCLDSLRQDVLCHADDELLYTEDGKVFGDGQVRECRDMAALREWTERNKI
ncbi:hypothetical protein IQ07DRAFT_601210 [Pyrenochaeta sp. DS3sAY3a]|nr:hypothetical protein IQ07DRAFT_601210 [Pyrenochaeta sp. DS3sAY3a]